MYKKGQWVLTNVGRSKGHKCKVVSVQTVKAVNPDGTERVERLYDVRTGPGNVVRRTEGKLAPAVGG